jgi:TRAP-type transport system periplasmic protein
MKTKKILLLLGSVGISLTLFLAVWPVSPATAQQAKVIEMNFNDQMGPTHLLDLSIKYFADQISKRTNGRVKITVFPVGTLTAPDKIYDSVVMGMSDMGNTSVAYSAGRFPSLDACFIPNPSKTGWVATHMSHDFWFKFRPKDNNDVHMLWLSSSGSYNLNTVNKPIYKTEDLKGLKIRASGPQLGAYVKALGATPVNMPMTDVYEAASKGVIDGFLTPWDTQKSWKHAEITKYVTIIPVRTSAPSMVFMNLQKWNSLPKDIQEIFTKLSEEMVEVQAKVWWQVDIEGENYFRGLGGDRKVLVIPPAEVPNWTKVLNPLVDTYVKDYTAKGLPAADYAKYVLDRANYWNERQVSPQEGTKWIKENLEPYLKK